MIIGGQPLLLYDEPGFTRDIGITLGASVAKLSKLL